MSSGERRREPAPAERAGEDDELVDEAAESRPTGDDDAQDVIDEDVVDDKVDEASKESFPTSDPPAW